MESTGQAVEIVRKSETGPEIETWVGHMLRYGVLLAALTVLTGGIWYLSAATGGGSLPDYSHFHGASSTLRTLTGIFSQVRVGRPEAIIQLGLLLLILTPVARVAMCIVGFALEKDRLYVLVSCTVMVVLLYSLLQT